MSIELGVKSVYRVKFLFLPSFISFGELAKIIDFDNRCLIVFRVRFSFLNI
jgi:hypothetical protein